MLRQFFALPWTQCRTNFFFTLGGGVGPEPPPSTSRGFGPAPPPHHLGGGVGIPNHPPQILGGGRRDGSGTPMLMMIPSSFSTQLGLLRSSVRRTHCRCSHGVAGTWEPRNGMNAANRGGQLGANWCVVWPDSGLSNLWVVVVVDSGRKKRGSSSGAATTRNSSEKGLKEYQIPSNQSGRKDAATNCQMFYTPPPFPTTIHTLLNPL